MDVEAAFGSGHTWPAPSGSLTDTGLVEFGWWDGQVTYFGAQTHRLRFLRGNAGRALVSRYGRFRKRLLLRDLDLAVRARGFQLEPRGSVNDGYAEYWQPSTGMGVIAATDPEVASPGTVLKMLGPTWRTPGIW
ncbi:hypothetical protein [Lentzea sp. NBRC 105346]|uniref:hypothetical protein n=1 Tax=Lentzea sp. NBRC 105346 TaxID=3032205 RepID=UPI002554B249|nr:hypothetical protein [Lentzea sp. NBRC 105346]